MSCDAKPYKLNTLFLMFERCSSCGLKFSKELGFFYGYVCWIWPKRWLLGSILCGYGFVTC